MNVRVNLNFRILIDIINGDGFSFRQSWSIREALYTLRISPRIHLPQNLSLPNLPNSRPWNPLRRRP